MRRQAFTLVELLVVIAIIALLLAMLVPELSMVRRITRSAICKTNLHQIHQAFGAAAGTGGTSAGGEKTFFPGPFNWPGTPMNTVPAAGIFRCPEASEVIASLSDYYIHTNFEGGIDIPFLENKESGLCRLIEDTDEYSIFGFEDGINPDLWTGSIDIRIKVTKTVPREGIRWDSGYHGAGRGVLSLYRGGQVVPGWEDFRHVPQGARFVMDGGATNYGLNAAVGRHKVAPDTVVLVDYDMLLANYGEDMSQHLADSARHYGKINVLLADGSVCEKAPSALDPAIADNAEQWSP